MGGVGVSDPVLVLDYLHPRGKRFGVDSPFVGPGAVKAGQPRVGAAERNRPGIEARQGYGLLPLVGYFGPGLYDVLFGECAVIECHCNGIMPVGKGDGDYGVAVVVHLGFRLSGRHKLQGHVAVGHRHAQGTLPLGIVAEDGIGVGLSVLGSRSGNLSQVTLYRRTIIHQRGRGGRVELQYQRSIESAYRNVFRRSPCGDIRKKRPGEQEFSFHGKIGLSI